MQSVPSSRTGHHAPALAKLAMLLFALLVLGQSSTAWATPFYSVGSAHACSTCHVEPLGWDNPDKIRDRRCTLDCQGCHVSPTGGGLRTPLGNYYGQEVLPMFGKRPSERANEERFAQEGWPVAGRYRIFKGFSGWWEGDVSHREIEDRYGQIDPSPVWQVGGDYRLFAVIPADGNEERDVAVFPMELQTYAAVHPLTNLTAYVDLGLQGSQQRALTKTGETPKIQFNDIFWIREVFAMVHDLPGSTYVRAGRFALPYGWRISDHSAYMRKGTFDQYAQGYGVEVGTAPNEFWGNLAAYWRGVENWPGESGRLTQGVGITGQGGARYLGFTAGATFHYLSLKEGGSELMMGPMWGLNLHPVTYIAELDYRRETNAAGKTVDRLFAFHELQYMGFRGLTPKLRYEWTDDNVLYKYDHRHRFVVGAEFNPYRNIQLDWVFRQELRARSASDKAPNKRELLVQIHGFF